MKTQDIDGAADKCNRVDPQVMGIIPVLVTQRRIDQVRRDFFQRSPNPEFLVNAKRDAEQLAIAVADALGEGNAIKQGRLWERQPDCRDNCTKNNGVTKQLAHST